MSDRELLELAAKAAGLHRCENYYTDAAGNHVEWSPLTDDGDALRLAVKLGVGLAGSESHVWACKINVCDIHEPRGSDPLAATRRAIVRAAAEIGRQMP